MSDSEFDIAGEPKSGYIESLEKRIKNKTSKECGIEESKRRSNWNYPDDNNDDKLSNYGTMESEFATEIIRKLKPSFQLNRDTVVVQGEQATAIPRNRSSNSWVFKLDKINTIMENTKQPYRMDNSKRGDCIIFNVTKVGMDGRRGTEVDLIYLKDAFSHLGFSIKVVDNPTKPKLEEEIKEYTKMNHSDNDCFACVILSHGFEGHIRTSEGLEIPLDDIINPIQNCSSLAGKPKLFFVQACRGRKTAHSLVTDASYENNTGIKLMSTHFDVLVSYATVKDYVAYRDENYGSIYIRILCALIKENGLQQKFTEILEDVNLAAAEISGDNHDDFYQVPTFTSTLRKPLLFAKKVERRPICILVIHDDGKVENIDKALYPHIKSLNSQYYV